MPKNTDDTLREITQAYIDKASAFIADEITPDREKALRYYAGENPDGLPVTPGRSKVVDPVVRDTIEWIMPSLMRIFTAGDKYISVEPHGPEDAQKARATEAWVNYVTTRANPGYVLDYQWIRDCLLEKVGWQKIWWEVDEAVERTRFDGLTPPELDALKAMPGVRVRKVTERPPPPPELPLPPMPGPLYDAQVEIERREAHLRIATLPPEEVLYCDDATLDRSSWWFVAHKSEKRISELRALGFDVADDINGHELESLENIERMSDADSLLDHDDDLAAADPAARKVWLYECYVRHDLDEDGEAEWVQVMRVGEEILSVETVDDVPMVCISPVLRSHRLTGYSLADLIVDLQELMTALHRALNDSVYLTVNPRSEIDVSGLTEHTVADLMDNRAGGIVRVRKPGTVVPLQQGGLPTAAMGLIDHWQAKLEARTGVTRFNQGLSPDTLNKTASGTSLIMQAANQRIELIARTLAETGFKDRVALIIKLSAAHPDYLAERTVQLNGAPLTLTANDLIASYDLIINTGIGTGNREQQLAHLTTLTQLYQAMAQAGLGPGSQSPLFSTVNVYNTVSEMLRLAGYRNVNDFLIDPQNPHALRDPPQPPKPTVEEVLAKVEGQKAQVSAMKTKAEAQIGAQQAALSAAKAKQEAQLEIARLQLEQQQIAIKERELALREYEMRAQTNAKLLEAQASTDEKSMASVIDFERELFERQMKERELAMRERETQAKLLAVQPPPDPTAELVAQVQALTEAVLRLTAPKRFERDESGRVVSINGAPVARDARGLVVGVGAA